MLGRYLEENKITLEQNTDRFKRTLELYLQKCVKTTKVIETPDINNTRVKVMEQKDFSIFMLIDVDGKLREMKGIECARHIMSDVVVARHLRKLDQFFPSFFTLSQSKEFKGLCPRNIKPFIDKIQTSNDVLKVYLASKEHVHASKIEQNAVVLKIADLYNKSSRTVCTYVLLEVTKYLKEHDAEKWTWKTVTYRWDKGRIRLRAGSLSSNQNATEAVLILEFKDYDLPGPKISLAQAGLVFK